MYTQTNTEGILEDETKRQAFIRLGNKRLTKLLDQARKLDNLFKNQQQYQATEADVDTIVQQLQDVIAHIQSYKQKIKSH